MSIPTPACIPVARPDPVPRAASPAGAGLWIAPAAWTTRTSTGATVSRRGRAFSTPLRTAQAPPTRPTRIIVVDLDRRRLEPAIMVDAERQE